MRLYISIKGNKIEKGGFHVIGLFFVLSIFVMVMFVYFLVWQTYALLIEYVIAGVAFLFALVETLMMLGQFIDYRSLEKAE